MIERERWIGDAEEKHIPDRNHEQHNDRERRGREKKRRGEAVAGPVPAHNFYGRRFAHFP
jgi:hypothetical protein